MGPKTSRPTREPGPIESVVVLRLSSIGDIVLTEPVVASLHDACPDAEIGFVVKREFRDLVAAHPAVTRLHVLGDRSGAAMRALVDEVRSVGYAAAVDLHDNFRTGRILRASGIPLRSTFRKRDFADGVRVRVLRRPFRASLKLVRRYLDALEPLGVRAPDRSPRLYLADRDAERAASLLDGWGLSDSPYAALVPGAVWPTKRWPVGRYAELAVGLAGEQGLRILLLGTGAERGLAETVAEAAGGSAVVAAGDTSLGETAALIARARLFVGNDSGPTHMSMALGTPTVAVFGPTDPGQFDHTGHALVYRDLDCSACTFFGSKACRLKHWDCMMSVGSPEVLRAAVDLLNETGGRP